MVDARHRRIGALLAVALVAAALGVLLPGGTTPAAAAGACPGGAVPTDRFTDDDTSVHEAGIACTTWWELTRGVSATAYAPSRDVTRGQAATMIARLLGRTGLELPASPADAFPDDTGGAHSFATNRLAATGVVTGRADGRFAPGAAVSRGAMASLLIAAYRAQTGIDPPTGGDHFSDDDGTVHERAIDQAAALGITVGSVDGRFDPWVTVTRGQAATLLARTLSALDAAGAISETPAQLQAATRLEPVGGCGPLLGTIKERALESVGPFGLGSFDYPVGGIGRDDDQSGVPPAPTLPGTGGGEASDGGSGAPRPDSGSSGTNNQELGVDEADFVKVQGSLIVTVNGGRLRVIDTTGGTPVLRGSLDVGADGDHRLLLDGTRLLVMTTTWSGGIYPIDDGPALMTSLPFVPSEPLTTLRRVDLTNPAAPVVTEDISIDGTVLSARLIDGVARIVVRTEPSLGYTFPAGGSPEDSAAATARNREIIEASSLADWVPSTHAAADGSGAAAPLLGCGDISAPPEFAGLGFSSVVTVDLEGPLADPHAVGVLAGSDLVYASPTTLYLASTRWQTWQPQGQGADRTRTDLHAFDISDPAGAAFLGSGRVVGSLLNQFSLSEHEGVLRVASTVDPSWFEDPASAPPSESRVTTLRLAGGALTQVGLLTGLGIDERIFGVRFLGEQGYVVTFRQIDPLHVLDLSDPANPTVAGELEMPGYSAYLHPIGDGLLIGVGADADADGRRTGTQVSLFDVSDPTAPVRRSNVTLPGAWTDVEYDHLAFLWWPASQRLVLPINRYAFDEATGAVTDEFLGAVGFAVDPVAGIAEVGRATHRDDAAADTWPAIRRSIVADGTLFTLSDAGLEAESLTDLSEKAWLPFS